MFYNPTSTINNSTASRETQPMRRFCFLGWHWSPSVLSVMVEVERIFLSSGQCIPCCQQCLRHWNETGRLHKGSLTQNYTLSKSSFRDRHYARIKRRLAHRCVNYKPYKPQHNTPLASNKDVVK